jgi:c-di-GMP-binding flagellar brake protein YcgR
MLINWQEKRRFSRLKILNPMRYQIRGTNQFDNVMSDNVSLGGIAFLNDSFIPPQTPLAMDIKVLSHVLNTTGIVKWSQPIPHSDTYRTGVEFSEMDAKDKQHLSELLIMGLQKGA